MNKIRHSIEMNRFLQIILFWFGSAPLLFAQDSLTYGQTFELDLIRYPACAQWDSDWTQIENESSYSTYFDSIAAFIKSNPQAKFQIRCSTDFRGSDSSNLRLSQKRANDWVKVLIQRGVDSSQIEGIGVGEMFARKVWYDDSVYYTQKPKGIYALEIYLNEDYINSFENDKKKLEYLHLLNKRTELVVSELDETAQRRVDYNLYLNQFHGDKQVKMIGLGTMQNNDTIHIVNSGTLHVHVVALGTENEFTIRSLENPEEHYYYHKFHGEPEKLLDLSAANGVYEITQFGDGGSGESILVISNE